MDLSLRPESIRRYRYEPGDTIVLRLYIQTPSDQEVFRAKMQLRTEMVLPPEVPILVLGRYEELTVVNLEAERDRVQGKAP